MPPVKPALCRVGDCVAVFMGTDYKLMDLPTLDKFIPAIQRQQALLRRELKQRKRANP